MRRATDSSIQGEKRFFQTDRFFKADGLWYFATREGIDFGPYTVRADGEKAVRRYIDTQHTMSRLRGRDPTVAEENKWDDQGVAEAAKVVSDWRADRQSRPEKWYSDRAGKRR